MRQKFTTILVVVVVVVVVGVVLVVVVVIVVVVIVVILVVVVVVGLSGPVSQSSSASRPAPPVMSAGIFSIRSGITGRGEASSFFPLNRQRETMVFFRGGPRRPCLWALIRILCVCLRQRAGVGFTRGFG